MTSQVIVGDCRQTLALLPEGSVNCIVTSFPYWSLRAYDGTEAGVQAVTWADGTTCPWGLEPTFEAWIAHSVEVCRHLWRVLRKDGTFWLNIGASYAGKRSFKGGKNTDGVFARRRAAILGAEGDVRDPAFKDGDLVQQGPLLAEALRREGWLLKSDVIVAKKNPKPESVKSRPANVHEHVFLLVKEEGYFYDHEAVREPYAKKTLPQKGTSYQGSDTKDREDGSESASDVKRRIIAGMEKRGGRNLRSVWEDPESMSPLLRKALDGKNVLKLQQVVVNLWALFEDLVFAPIFQELAATQLGGDGSLPEHWDWEKIEAIADWLEEPGPDSLWWFVNQAVPGAHTATFGEKFVETCIKAGCPKGGMVLDPCGGSGTTGVVAERLGRDSILLELSPVYAAQAEARIADPDWATKERKRLRDERAREAQRAAWLKAGRCGTCGGELVEQDSPEDIWCENGHNVQRSELDEAQGREVQAKK